MPRGRDRKLILAQGRGLGKGYGFGVGRSMECICPNCEFRVPHRINIPCYDKTCPKCGTKMTRVM